MVFTGAVKPPRSILPKNPNLDALRPDFGWTTADRVKATLENTTQWFRASGRFPMGHQYKTRFPAANVPLCNEDVATDTFFSDIPAHDDGMVVVLWHRFIPEFLAILQKFTLFLLSPKFQIRFVTFFVIEEH